MGAKRRRAGSGSWFGLGNITAPKRASTSKALFRSKHMTKPGTATFSPGRGWQKGAGTAARDIGQAGQWQSGQKLYQAEGTLTEGGWKDLGGSLDVYQGEGTGIGPGIERTGDANITERWRDVYHNPLDWGIGSEADYVTQGWTKGVRQPYEAWWKGELKESQDFHGVRERELDQDLETTLKEGGADLSALEGDNILLPAATEEWQDLSSGISSEMDVQLEALRDVWIADDDYAEDDPRYQARQDLLDRAAEAGLEESDIFGDEEVVTGTGWQDIEGAYEAAQEDKDVSSRQAARERIKANLQGGAGVRGAQAAAGASGLAYSGAHEGRIEEASTASQDELARIRAGERQDLGALQQAREDRVRAYENVIEGVTGETGAFKTFEDKKQEKYEMGESYLDDALSVLQRYGKELESMLTYGPSKIIAKDKPALKKRQLKKQRSRFFGGGAMEDVSEYSTRYTPYKKTKTALEGILGAEGGD